MDAPSRRNNSRSSRNTTTKTSPPPPDQSKMGAERSVRNLKISKALTMKEGTSVFDVCKRMGTRKVVAALLIDSSSTLSGIITDKDVATKVVAAGLDARDTPASMVMTRNPQHVTIDTNAIEALDKMIQGKFRHLPVVENGEVVGLLDITKCLYDAISKMENAAEKGSAIAAAVEGVERQYGDVRSDFVETLRERMFRPTLSTIISDATKAVIVAFDDSVFLAAKRMRDNGVSSVIIMSGQKLHGILTSKDILSRVLLQNLPAESTTVEKMMTKNPKCVTSSTKLLDALRIMRDGNFLHLPVIDSESSILGCVDVLQLTHAAMALFGNSSVNENELSTSMMQKFWDSTIALGLPETEDDSLSDACPSLASEMTGYQSLGMGDVFTFKMWDMMGRVHRFTSGIKSLSELISAVVQRIGDSTDDNCKPQIMYEDDEGDKVLLSTDNDLSTAVCHARMAGWKALKLYVYNPQSVASKDNGSLEPVPSTQVQNQNKSVRYPLVILGMVLLVGISVTMYKRRSS